MIELKIEQTEKGLAIVLTPEAQELLGAADGQTIGFQVTDDGELRLGALDMSFEARRARGRAFLKRYDETFKALAK
ncbi:MAG: hypothetical protein GC203_03500 [Phenylobacterium sp.]|uniref:hypothetical protein n=1 Tax=Phenylobacterium sp. TaxID=1871053 RepID=UPI0025D122C5|nr:hypothetical protein [Phenylobacterium sp.]MBI1196904.1 hypothetical protein [Phenylobacterium sp.]